MTSLPFRTSSMRAESSALAWDMLRTTISMRIAQIWSGLGWATPEAESTLTRGLQVLIQMAQAGELPGEAGSARRARGAARAEIAAAEEVAPGDHGGTHRAVLVGALRPG